MKTASKLIAAFLMCFAVCVCFGQDSTAVGAATGGFSLPAWVGVVAPIVLGVYELIIRYVPTVKNYSIIGWIIKIIQLIVPNNNANTPSQPHP